MELLLKNPSQLAMYKERFVKDYSTDFRGETIVGKQGTGSENSMFIWDFSQSDLEDFINIFAEIKNRAITRGTVDSISWRLREKTKDMRIRGICPVECLLYASKTINNIIEQKIVFDEVVDVLYTTVQDYDNQCTDVLNHIIKNWGWMKQVKIVIGLCGRLANVELLKNIHIKYSRIGSVKVMCFKAMMDSGKIQLLDLILDMVSRIDDTDVENREIANYFKDKFEFYYMPEGEEKVVQLLGIGNLTPFAKKTLAKVINTDTAMEGTRTKKQSLTYLIQKAMLSSHNSDISEAKKREYINEITACLNNKDTRKEAFIALSFTNSYDAGRIVEYTLKNSRCTTQEIREGIMTIGFLGYVDAMELVLTYAKDERYKIYAWAALILMGNEGYCENLIDELFNERITTAYEVSKVIKKILKRNARVRETFLDKLMYILNNNTDVDRIRALNNAEELIKIVVNQSVLDKLFELMGYNAQTINISENLEAAIMDTIKNIITKENAGKFEGFLFYVINNRKFSQTIRSKSLDILRNPEVFITSSPESR